MTTHATTTYEFRVACHLDDHWASLLDGLTLVRRCDGTTTMTGPIADQAHLHGVLARIRDLGVPLLALRALDAGDAGHATSAASPATPGECSSD